MPKLWDAFLAGMDFNEKATKPTERSEETMDEFTRNIRNLITDKLTVHTKGLDGSEISSTVFIDDKTAKDIASGILFYVGKEAMKNPDREIPEWSEEDKNTLGDAITAVDMMLTDSFQGSHPNLFKAFLIAKDFLKSLPERFNLQPKQEWSEEDRKTLDGAIFWLKKHFDKHTIDIDTENSPMSLKTALTRIESLRHQPHWKPSEEQMERLVSIIAALRKDYCDDMADFLANLYNDLKKLM